MERKIIISQSYLPATCFALVQQKYPTNLEKVLQPYVAEIKRFSSIYKTQTAGLIQLLKISDNSEIELIQAAFYQLLKQKLMNFQSELVIIQDNLAQYRLQLQHLCASNNMMNPDDTAIISKHYRDNIEALTAREKKLIDAIEVEASIVEPTIYKKSC